MRQSAVRVLGLLVLTSFIVGCGPSGRPTVETTDVSGTVTLDGQPLSGAQVNFLTDEYAGVATTDESGRFEMEAQAGENTVYVTKYEGVDGTFDATMLAPSDDGSESGPKQIIPKKFSDPNETELSVTVPDGGISDANLELTSR